MIRAHPPDAWQGTPEYNRLFEVDPLSPAREHEDPQIKGAKQRAIFESQLRAKGFIVRTEVSVDQVTHYVKISTPFALLCDMAETQRMRMPLKDREQKLMDVPGFFSRLLVIPPIVRRIFETGVPDDEDIASAPFKTKFLEVASRRLSSFSHNLSRSSWATTTRRSSSRTRSAIF